MWGEWAMVKNEANEGDGVGEVTRASVVEFPGAPCALR